MRPDASYTLIIQIVNFRSKQLLINLLRSIQKHPPSCGYMIKVLENGSGDDLSDLEVQFPTLDLAVYETPRNFGFGAGHNLLARKDPLATIFLLLLNPDCEIRSPGTVDGLLRALGEHPECAVAGAQTLGFDGNLAEWDHGEIEGLINRVVVSVTAFGRWKRRFHSGRVAWVSGACMLIRRKDFIDQGGFDERFFMYYEEVDLQYRLSGSGRYAWYEATAQVYHKGGGSGGDRNTLMALSNEHFNRKHLRPWNPVHLVMRLSWWLRGRKTAGAPPSRP